METNNKSLQPLVTNHVQQIWGNFSEKENQQLPHLQKYKTNHPFFSKYTKVLIGNGNKTNLWNDCWLGKPLRNLFVGPLQKEDETRTVNSITSSSLTHRDWNLTTLPSNLDPSIIIQIKSIPLSQLPSPHQDVTSWKLTSNGLIKFAYQQLHLDSYSTNIDSQTNNSSLSWIWRNPTHPRENFHLWQSFHKGLPTKKNLKKRLNHISDHCTFCNSAPESYSHILRDCS